MFRLSEPQLEEVCADVVERHQRLADLLLIDGWTMLRWSRAPPDSAGGRSSHRSTAPPPTCLDLITCSDNRLHSPTPNRLLPSARADPPVMIRHITDWTDVPPLDFRI